MLHKSVGRCHFLLSLQKHCKLCWCSWWHPHQLQQQKTPHNNQPTCQHQLWRQKQAKKCFFKKSTFCAQRRSWFETPDNWWTVPNCRAAGSPLMDQSSPLEVLSVLVWSLERIWANSWQKRMIVQQGENCQWTCSDDFVGCGGWQASSSRRDCLLKGHSKISWV